MKYVINLEMKVQLILIFWEWWGLQGYQGNGGLQ